MLMKEAHWFLLLKFIGELCYLSPLFLILSITHPTRLFLSGDPGVACRVLSWAQRSTVYQCPSQVGHVPGPPEEFGIALMLTPPYSRSHTYYSVEKSRIRIIHLFVLNIKRSYSQTLEAIKLNYQ